MRKSVLKIMIVVGVFVSLLSSGCVNQSSHDMAVCDDVMYADFCTRLYSGDECALDDLGKWNNRGYDEFSPENVIKNSNVPKAVRDRVAAKYGLKH